MRKNRYTTIGMRRRKAEKFQKRARITAEILFFIYCGTMLYLLIFMRFTSGGVTFLNSEKWSEDFQNSFQLIPFRTITSFTGAVKELSVNDHAFRNLAGNVVLFIPFGLFLPFIFEKQRSFPFYLLSNISVITCVELIQAFTLTGTCDIDDLILNTVGGCIGFLLYKLMLSRFTETKRW